MPRTAPEPAREATVAPGLQRWLTWHAVTMIAGACGAATSFHGGYLAIPALVSFAVLWWRERARHTALGSGISLADSLTASRLCIVLLATASMPRVGAAWVMAAFSYNVAVDAVDGYAARRAGEATPFGAVLDREVDALFVLSAYLYFHFHSASGLGPWLLLAGLLPYLYRLSVAALSVPVTADKKERLAAPLAGLNFILILSALALPPFTTPILVVSLCVVLLSFAPSFWNLYRHAYSFS